VIFPRLERTEDGVVFEDLAPAFILLLLEIPDLLGPDQPEGVKERLFPKPSDDAAIQNDWQKYVHPELFALLASAREIATKDLGNIEPSESDLAAGMWRLKIPGEHMNGWIAALNAARLALGARHGIEAEDDLHPEDDEFADEPPDERRIAIAKIHLLGEMQALLILDRSPPPGYGAEDDPEPA